MKATIQTALYGLHVIKHPFDGFWELKHHKKNTKSAALMILALIIVAVVLKIQSTHFLFNSIRPEDINILMQVGGVIVALTLWVVVNWSITTLFDGKATMGQIMVATIFSLVPLILLYLPQVCLSYFLTTQEGVFLGVLGTVAALWSLWLAIAGSATIQDYTVSKTILMFVSTIIAILAVLFLLAVFYSSLQQFWSFLYSILIEIKYWI